MVLRDASASKNICVARKYLFFVASFVGWQHLGQAAKQYFIQFSHFWHHFRFNLQTFSFSNFCQFRCWQHPSRRLGRDESMDTSTIEGALIRFYDVFLQNGDLPPKCICVIFISFLPMHPFLHPSFQIKLISISLMGVVGCFPQLLREHGIYCFKDWFQ